MMIATCNGPSDRSWSCVAGTAAFDISRSLGDPWGSILTTSDGEDFLFLGRKQLVDFGDHAVGRLLHVGGQTLLIVLGNLVILLELLHGIEPVAPNMAHRDLGRLG